MTNMHNVVVCQDSKKMNLMNSGGLDSSIGRTKGSFFGKSLVKVVPYNEIVLNRSKHRV